MSMRRRKDDFVMRWERRCTCWTLVLQIFVQYKAFKVVFMVRWIPQSARNWGIAYLCADSALSSYETSVLGNSLLVDRIHLLEKRYKTFTELIHLEGTFWNEPNNTIIVPSQTWATRLPENHILGAYHSHGDPAYSKLRELFELVAVDDDVGGTLIILSDSVSTQSVVCDAPVQNRCHVEMAEANSSNKFSCARRKLLFDDGGPLDLESTNKKAGCFLIPGKDGQVEMVEKKVTGRILERDFPLKSPTLAYSCGSSNPVPKYRMSRKPNV
ncbi:uncharacterized protein LOC125203548 [Salvia hispanica]|uniref:uncharacterized protein LOC125203548 n=1 Tax=Salvia hispanica TaxID=49212 RepID=UPI0020096C0E|nr:uncharacterized protein LOC125203548 [Salvia hispanica]